MFETIKKTTLKVNEATDADVGAGHVNGILVSANHEIVDFTLTVRLRSNKGTRVLVQDIPLEEMALISSNRFGQNITGASAMLGTMFYTTLTMPDKRGMGEVGSNSAVFGSVEVPLGSIYLSRGEELVVTLRRGSKTSLNSDEPVTIMTYTDNRAPHHLLTYEQELDDQVTFHDCMEVYAIGKLFKPDVHEYMPELPQLQCKTGDMSYIADIVDIHSATVARGFPEMPSFVNYGETEYANSLVSVWQNSGVIPQTVEMRLTGGKADSFKFIGVQKVFIQARTTQTNVEELQRYGNQIEELERKEPEKAKALRHAGEIPKSVEVKKTVAVMETAEE